MISIRNLVFLCMCSAFCVSILRFFTLTETGVDASLQILSAQMLIDGNGLTVFSNTNPFLSEKPAATLTHFPAGYSLFVSGLLWLGSPLFLVPKIFGIIFTFLGWWGWARFLVRCLPAEKLQAPKQVAWGLLAILLPLFTTPSWDGTDIFLWAAVPWVLKWVCVAPSHEREYLLYSFAGFVCGVCCLMRYASVFLAACLGLVVILQSLTNFKKLLTRGFVFGLATLLPILVQLGIFATASGGEVAPGGIRGGGSYDRVLGNLAEGLRLLPTWNVSLFFWLPDGISRNLIGKTDYPVFTYFFVFVLACLPFLFWLQAKKSGVPVFQDLKFLASLLSVFLPVFLLLCMVVGSYDYVGDRRYYIPLIPLVVLLIAHFAFFPREGKLWRFLLQSGSSLFLFGFLTMGMLGALFIFLPGAHGQVMRNKIMGGSDLSSFPSMGMAYEKSRMRQFVVDYWSRNPDMHLLTNFEWLFLADPKIQRERLHGIPECHQLRGQEVSGPKSILIAAVDFGDEEFYHVGIGRTPPSPCIKKIRNFTTLQTFDETIYPATKVRVLKAEIPAGVTIRF